MDFGRIQWPESRLVSCASIRWCMSALGSWELAVRRHQQLICLKSQIHYRLGRSNIVLGPLYTPKNEIYWTSTKQRCRGKLTWLYNTLCKSCYKSTLQTATTGRREELRKNIGEKIWTETLRVSCTLTTTHLWVWLSYGHPTTTAPETIPPLSYLRLSLFWLFLLLSFISFYFSCLFLSLSFLFIEDCVCGWWMNY